MTWTIDNGLVVIFEPRIQFDLDQFSLRAQKVDQEREISTFCTLRQPVPNPKPSSAHAQSAPQESSQVRTDIFYVSPLVSGYLFRSSRLQSQSLSDLSYSFIALDSDLPSTSWSVGTGPIPYENSTTRLGSLSSTTRRIKSLIPSGVPPATLTPPVA